MIITNNYLDQIFALRGKKVLVTGCCGQLGIVICKSFLDVGSIVIGVDLDVENGDRIDHKNISYHSCDITKKQLLSNLFNDLYVHGESVDVLINNAGVSTFENFEDRTESEFEWVTDVNLKGTFLCIQEYFKYQGNNKSGNIVNIASIYGVISPDPRIYEDGDRKNSEVYGATKAGIIQMTKYFAIHLAKNGIRVNSVSPGGIFNSENPQKPKFIQEYSKRNPMGRMANANEMTGAILFLSSSASTYVTGLNLVVDGGMSCW
jgi:NAD(P)-dependent dehydrogenase (short-subunit alcohol dehydrogenase family)